MKIVPVEISARHIHLSQADLDKLFGVGYKLRIKKKLSQPGEFASQETVDLVGPKTTIKNVRVLGPVRAKTQIELAMTDCYRLNINAPLRLSGDTIKSAGITLVGPKSKLILKEGVIIAKRHLHISEVEAKKLKLKNGAKVKIKIKGDRSLIFENVIVRVKESFATSVHLDTDEANAAGMKKCGEGELML